MVRSYDAGKFRIIVPKRGYRGQGRYMCCLGSSLVVHTRLGSIEFM